MPSKAKKISVMTMSNMGTSEKLHNSHFYNTAVAAGALKHKKLVEHAHTQIDSNLHSFVQGERDRLKARKHLKAVDELTKNVDIPDTLKHHSAFNQVYGWLLTREQHHERIEKLSAFVSTTLPKHCKQFRHLRDKNRIKAMSDQQRAVYFRKIEAEKEMKRRKEDEFRKSQGLHYGDAMGTDEFDISQPPMAFLSPDDAFSNTGLRRANTKDVGYVEFPRGATGAAPEVDVDTDYTGVNSSGRERMGRKLR